MQIPLALRSFPVNRNSISYTASGCLLKPVVFELISNEIRRAEHEYISIATSRPPY